MADEIRALVCPQCGGAEVKMLSETEGECAYCGSRILLKKDPPPEPEAGEKSGEPAKAVIRPSYSGEAFLRKAWEALAAEDAPFEAFQGAFGEVSAVEHLVYCEAVTASARYEVTVGFDREERYTDYEDYYEEIPYTDADGVEKTRREKRQRAVTRTRIVTDWHPGETGEVTTESLAAVSAREGLFLDEARFGAELARLDRTRLEPAGAEAAAAMTVPAFAEEAAKKRHTATVERAVTRALPGDRQRDLRFRWRASTRSRLLLSVQEYRATLHFEGRDYEKRAFPFGNMTVAGDRIPNPQSLADQKETKKREWDGRVWKKIRLIHFLTLGLLLLSIPVSLFVPSPAAVLAVFLAAAGMMAFTTVRAKKEERSVTEEIRRENEDLEAGHRARLEELLARKLAGLGGIEASGEKGSGEVRG